MTLKKSGRFLFRLLGFGGEVEGDKRMLREQPQKGGGFAGLSGASQHDHWPSLSGALQTGFNSARNPHKQNIRYNRIFCTFVFLTTVLITGGQLSLCQSQNACAKFIQGCRFRDRFS
jgi:hypothetical protein